MTALPNNEIVTVAWLKSAVPYLEGRVATALPSGTDWEGKGFVTVSTVGGVPDNYVGWRMPVMSVDFWAMSVDSGRAPWNLASQLAEQTREAILDHPTVGRAVTLPDAYGLARVESVMMLTEPTRVRGDVGNYAHYTADIQVRWKAL